MSALFSPFSLKDVTLRNRIAVPPMCQYSALDGFTTDWHPVHYASLARGGAGLVVVEATGVSPEGRITPGCTGLWKDAQAEGLARVAAGIRAAGAVPGIQLGHAGRKASLNRPWEGDDHIPEGDPRGWQPIAPSALAFGASMPRVPREMTQADIERVRAYFAAAARRARDAGFQWLELHFAHGFLAQGFFSTHTNRRTDAYGGSFAHRARFLVETLAAVRAVWPERLPLAVRFGVLEFDGRDEQTLPEAIELVRRLRAAGLDLLNVSLGFSIPAVEVPWSTPAFLLPVAGRVRREAALPVVSSWSVDDPWTAERAVAEGQLDLVMMGKAHLANPHYPWEVARALGLPRPESVLPPQYGHWLQRWRGPAGAPAE